MAFLHEDALFHISSRLPAKSLCKFKSVCKSSWDLSEETFFSMKQATNMLLKDDTCVIVQPGISQRDNDRIEIYPLPGEESSSGVPKKFLNHLAKSARILASSNGLVLCRSTRYSRDQLFICNPMTQTWLPIATPAMVRESPNDDVNVVFHCINNDFDLDDYKIILIEKSPEWWSPHLHLKVSLLKEGVWEALEESFFAGGREMRLDMPVYIHNALHFISDSSPYLVRRSPYFRPYIMAYNLESGQSTMLRLPKDARRGSHDSSCDMGIFEWGKVKSLDHSICLVRHMKLVFTIWILVDYMSGLWRRILKMRVKAMGLKEEDPKIQGFTVMNGDCLIFATKKKVYRYDLSGRNSRSFQVIREYEGKTEVCFTPYSNTLRSCGTGETTFPSPVISQLSEDEDDVISQLSEDEADFITSEDEASSQYSSTELSEDPAWSR